MILKEFKKMWTEEGKKSGLAYFMVNKPKTPSMTIPLKPSKIPPALKNGVDTLIALKNKKGLTKIHNVTVIGTVKEKDFLTNFNFSANFNNKLINPQFVSRVDENEFEEFLRYVCQSIQDFKWMEGKGVKE